MSYLSVDVTIYGIAIMTSCFSIGDVEVYHLEKGWDAGIGSVKIVESGPLRAVLVAEHPITETSTLVQKIILNASSGRLDFETHVDWTENRKILVSQSFRFLFKDRSPLVSANRRWSFPWI